MTTSEKINMIGQYARLPIKGLEVSVKILDIRDVFGRVDAQVTPEAGGGSAWVDIKSLKTDAPHMRGEKEELK